MRRMASTASSGETPCGNITQRSGGPGRWQEIYQLNRGQAQANGYALTDPDEIDIGWRTALPRGTSPRSPPPRPPVNRLRRRAPAPTRRCPRRVRLRTRAPRPTAVTACTHRRPSNPAATTHRMRLRRPAAAPLCRHVGPPPSPTTGVDETPSTSPLDGVDLPGGWITAGLGAGLLAAVAMVWWRRRHRDKPTPITGPRLNDPDLLPPLAAMTRIRTSMRRVAPETLDEQSAPAPTVREYRAALGQAPEPPARRTQRLGPGRCRQAAAHYRPRTDR